MRLFALALLTGLLAVATAQDAGIERLAAAARDEPIELESPNPEDKATQQILEAVENVVQSLTPADNSGNENADPGVAEVEPEVESPATAEEPTVEASEAEESADETVSQEPVDTLTEPEASEATEEEATNEDETINVEEPVDNVDEPVDNVDEPVVLTEASEVSEDEPVTEVSEVVTPTKEQKKAIEKYNGVVDNVLEVLSKELKNIGNIPIVMDESALSSLDAEVAEPEPEPEPEPADEEEKTRTNKNKGKKNKAKKAKTNKNKKNKKGKKKGGKSDVTAEKESKKKNKKNKRKGKENTEDDTANDESSVAVEEKGRKNKKDKAANKRNDKNNSAESGEKKKKNNKPAERKDNSDSEEKKNKKNNKNARNNNKNKRNKRNNRHPKALGIVGFADGDEEATDIEEGRRNPTPTSGNKRKSNTNKRTKSASKKKNKKQRKNKNKNKSKGRSDLGADKTGPTVYTPEEKASATAKLIGLSVLERDGDISVDSTGKNTQITADFTIGPLTVDLKDKTRSLKNAQVSTTVSATASFKIKAAKARTKISLVRCDCMALTPEDITVLRSDIDLETEVVSTAQQELVGAIDTERISRILTESLEGIFKKDNTVENLENHPVLVA